MTKKLIPSIIAILCLTGCSTQSTAEDFTAKAEAAGYPTIHYTQDDYITAVMPGATDAVVARNGTSEITFSEFNDEGSARTVISTLALAFGDTDPAEDIVRSYDDAAIATYAKRRGNTVAIVAGGTEAEFEESVSFLNKLGY